MEREGPEETYRVLRAIRSLVYNRQLQPLVAQRIEGAEATIRSHLLIHNTAEAQIGPYRVELDGSDTIHLTRLAADEWRQLPLTWTEECLALTEEPDGSGDDAYFVDPSEPLPASILYEGTRF